MTNKEYKIEIDPRILELLGPSLYTNIYYVLAELIANAYDADAHNVYIIEKESEIIVEDDGKGMSYEAGDIDKYLEIARLSRTSDDDSYTDMKRRKMGRKGVGKLAALSVSEEVYVKTVVNGEKSGFILSRHVSEDRKLQALEDEQITFERISNQGTSIAMTNPHYKLHATAKAIRRNIIKIFPLVDKDFRIHIIKNGMTEVIDSVEKDIASQLSNLIILGDDFNYLLPSYNPISQDYKDDLCVVEPEKSIQIELFNRDNLKKNYDLRIKGWIGTYITTKNRKAEKSDFPDNYISLYSNKKMGEFNILPLVGKNKMTEVYVVGQLHVDLFELTELPDMALSNRQGYKSDDLRYQKVLEYVREDLLPRILRMRDLYTDIRNKDKLEAELIKKKQDEEKLKKAVSELNEKSSQEAAKTLMAKINNGEIFNESDVEKIISKEISTHSSGLGIKTSVDSNKKKILISHTSADHDVADVIYEMLKYNNVPPKDILYTSCQEEEARIPEMAAGKSGIYDYLRDFFVNSISDQKPYIIFVTSAKMGKSWGAITEVGACWILKHDHKVFNIYDEGGNEGEKAFRPQNPLDTETMWQNIKRSSEKELCITELECDTFAQKIKMVCEYLGYDVRSKDENKEKLHQLVCVREAI